MEHINDVLRSENLHTMIVQSYDARGRILVIAFPAEGGPAGGSEITVRASKLSASAKPSGVPPAGAHRW
jgi:hypothetical protein